MNNNALSFILFFFVMSLSFGTANAKTKKPSERSYTCNDFTSKGSYQFRYGVAYLKRQILKNDLDQEVFPILFAQIANESGFGTSVASVGNNFGGKLRNGAESSYETFSSPEHFFDFFVGSLQNSKYGKCLSIPANNLTRFERSQKYIKCILGQQKTPEECVAKKTSGSGGYCYCTSGCSELYYLQLFSSIEDLPSKMKGYGTYANFKIGEALLDSVDDCGYYRP